MVDKNVITSRIEQIDKHLERIFPYSKMPREDFLKDISAQDIVEYNLFQTINHIIDVIQHIVIDEDYGLPQTAYEAAQFFLEKGVFDPADMELLKKMIGFRNIVGHDYIDLDKNVVYFILTDGQKDIQRILAKITKNFL
ncbi:MAG: DUF86 domain-containing protein [Candidatus Omnitrophica bacterium]|nr:DUF86 domain-containing protein [Candidatus Omnitrophota bacterium]